MPTVPPSAAPSLVHPAWVARLTGWPGITFAFLWGFAESTFFFIVPDVAISLVALFAPSRAWRHITAAIIGSVLGGALLSTWAAQDQPAAHDAVAKVPFITPLMFAKVDEGYETHGISAVFLGPLTGIPYKLYAVAAPPYVGRSAFLIATVPARAERFLIVWLFFGVVGYILRSYRLWKPSQLALLHGTLWIVFYAVYWGRIVLR